MTTFEKSAATVVRWMATPKVNCMAYGRKTSLYMVSVHGWLAYENRLYLLIRLYSLVRIWNAFIAELIPDEMAIPA